MNRRRFVRDTSLAMPALWLNNGLRAAELDPSSFRLTLLHTNDVHSRLDPFPMDGSRLQGLGGVARRAALIDRIRQEETNVLLLDAGDMLQGTPYFNLFDGEPEFRSMTAMGYDAGLLGNHDFDGGLELLDRQWPLMDFPVLNANYDMRDTVLAGRLQSSRIFDKGPIRIGVFGLGIELKGLVPDPLFGGTRYLDPIPVADEIAADLKRAGCHLIICLSHLGYRYDREDRISDVRLARGTKNIDIIIGGHTHTFLDTPVMETNASGEPVHIAQVGWAGVVLGRLDIDFQRHYRRKSIRSENRLVRHATD